jgi:hypothetical protein
MESRTAFWTNRQSAFINRTRLFLYSEMRRICVRVRVTQEITEISIWRVKKIHVHDHSGLLLALLLFALLLLSSKGLRTEDRDTRGIACIGLKNSQNKSIFFKYNYLQFQTQIILTKKIMGNMDIFSFSCRLIKRTKILKTKVFSSSIII